MQLWQAESAVENHPLVFGCDRQIASLRLVRTANEVRAMRSALLRAGIHTRDLPFAGRILDSLNADELGVLAAAYARMCGEGGLQCS
jgi:hypothetical protein